jgi:hypothetical protein
MGEMVVIPRPDPIGEACEDVYEGEGIFADGGWVKIPRAVSRDLIPGEDFGQFMADLPPSVRPVIDLEMLDQIRQVEWRRERVDALVAPAILAVAQRAQAEHWTVDELVRAVKGIAAEFRPRTERLAKNANPGEE